MLPKQYFTIGEMAKLHHISESTLRYYDEKDIFKPNMVDQQTNYRYYTLDQFSMLDTIKFLRNLDISLQDIKHFMANRTPNTVLHMLEKQAQRLQEQKNKIEFMLEKMNDKAEMIKQSLQASPRSVWFTTIPLRHIISMPVAPDASDEMFDYYINSLQNQLLMKDFSLFSGDIGITIKQDSLSIQQTPQINDVFIILHHVPNNMEDLSTIIAENYACIHHIGPYDNITESYEILLLEIQQRGYEIIGNGIELMIIDLAVTGNQEEYVTEIQIPVKAKT
ncbi:MerR family transcriptional regulator [Virgibacillus salarius]|uniref:MerR family transcriptional regulator n=1 Tax=Virgibacillus salarius TaxID=447199 RepID=UPI0031E39532